MSMKTKKTANMTDSFVMIKSLLYAEPKPRHRGEVNKLKTLQP